MENPTGYVSMWEAFAKRKASSYLGDKYELGNVVGLVGCAREHEIIRLLELKPDDVLLDIGCASGHQVFAAAPHIAKAVGIDVADNFIQAAKEFATLHDILNTEFICTDGGTIPFQDASFSKAICSEVVEHLVDPLPFLYEIRRVLKPGGIIVFTVPNLNSRGTVWKRFLAGFKEPPFTPMTEFSMDALVAHGDAHVWQFTLARFEGLIASSGLIPNYVGGAGYIDGPYIGRIIQLTNRLGFFRWLTFYIEKVLSRIPLFKSLSRQIILRAKKA